MDTGGPITMTYNNQHNAFPMASGLVAPGAGFASRGKATGLKRLQLATAPKVGSISENPLAASAAEGPDGIAPLTSTQDRAPTPRTSRSHLLAGLRTQPRTPSALSASAAPPTATITSSSSSINSSIHAAPPASAPYYKTTHNPSLNLANGQYSQAHNVALPSHPHTAIGANFPALVHQSQPQPQQQFSINSGQQFYTLPEQVLAPPPLELDEADEQLDPEVIRQLYATELYLAQRQQQLQQQIAALNGQAMKFNQTSFPQTPVTPQQFGLYNQPQVYSQVQNIPGTAIFTQELAGQPGVYIVYNALTGQSTLHFDQNAQQLQQQAELTNSPPPPTPGHGNSYMVDPTAAYKAGSPVGGRSRSPKKSTSPDTDVQPLPPPSANAFRRGHNRNRSSLVLNPAAVGVAIAEGPKSAMVRPVGIPATPMTGTFGPGQARAGEHPIRQPMGPPSIEELKEKPTTKFEGSKNFATRQRRRALNKLVRAGLERRVATGSASTTRPGSGGSLTPVSDTEPAFSLPASSDNESDVSSAGKSVENIGLEKLSISDAPVVGQIVN